MENETEKKWACAMGRLHRKKDTPTGQGIFFIHLSILCGNEWAGQSVSKISPKSPPSQEMDFCCRLNSFLQVDCKLKILSGVETLLDNHTGLLPHQGPRMPPPLPIGEAPVEHRHLTSVTHSEVWVSVCLCLVWVQHAITLVNLVLPAWHHGKTYKDVTS